MTVQKNAKKYICILLAALLAIGIVYLINRQANHHEEINELNHISTAGKKVLYVDSYHAEREGGVARRGIARQILEAAGVEMRVAYMDAKRKKSDQEQQQQALKVKQVIETWKPDLVLAADDAASKYLIMPYYRDAEIPVVFIGVNWDAGQYGYPYKNVTGQIEIELITDLLDKLKEYARGERIGVLTGETLSDRKTIGYHQDVLGIGFEKVVFASDFKTWKLAYQTLQQEVDILFIKQISGITGWDNDEAQAFVYEHTVIPAGTGSPTPRRLVLIGYAKVNEEIGQYGAETALQILNGTSPQDIPISRNKQAKVFLNMRLAKKLNIKFPIELIERAHLISAEQKKLLYVNSYHKGWKWSDGIERSLLKTLKIKMNPDGSYDTSQSDVQIKIFRMDTKLNKSEDFKKQKALEAKAIIEEWKPDIVVASDDNASKYLIAEYYKNAQIPFVFCGLNWDASVYGFPVSNVTGMIEVSPIREIIEMLKEYAKGDRIGFIGVENISARKEILGHKNILGVKYADGKHVSTFDEWKKEYLRLQDTVDMLILLNPGGVKGWDPKAAEDFVLKNVKIPSGEINEDVIFYAMLGKIKIAEEQGWWAGKTALRILNGESPADIPIMTNKRAETYLNMKIAKQLGIKFPMELIKKATFVEELPPGGVEK